MLTTLDHISLAWNRACKNRTSFHFATRRLTQLQLRGPLPAMIQAGTTANNALIADLDAILDHLGRPGAPLAP